MGSLKVINIKNLKSGINVREEVDDTLNELIDSIKANGLITPITVREVSGGKYEIIAGHRRYEALKRIGEPMVECNVVDDICTKEDIYKVQLAENIQRKNMSALEYVRMFTALKKEYGFDNTKLALYLNKKLSWVRDQYTAYNLLIAKYGEEEKIPEDLANKSSATIKAVTYNGRKQPAVRREGNGFTCTQKRHSYMIFCTDFNFETKLHEFLKANGMVEEDQNTTTNIK